MLTVCDLGVAVARALVEREAAAAGLPAPAHPPDTHPAHVVLPKNLFDCSQSSQGGAPDTRRTMDVVSLVFTRDISHCQKAVTWAAQR